MCIMCMFPVMLRRENKYGLKYYNCGRCPECLSKKMNTWALRAVYESKNYASSCMVTLTYNDAILDARGLMIGETDPKKYTVDKRDCQLFIKRLRKYFEGQKIKYIITAEYGKRTHRPHYHAILFGVSFPDMVRYKRSKRGNIIYKSAILNKLWKNGICTIDNVNINAASAKYCTKYAVKDCGNEDTFMLFSQGLGVDQMLADFNGLYYMLEGIKYPIPKLVWNKYIALKYKEHSSYIDYKYHNKKQCKFDFDTIQYYRDKNIMFNRFKHYDNEYIDYLKFWSSYIAMKPYKSVAEKIDLLDNRKYGYFKPWALKYHNTRKYYKYLKFPLFNSNNSYTLTDLDQMYLQEYHKETFPKIIDFYEKKVAAPSCLLAATDTKKQHWVDILLQQPYDFTNYPIIPTSYELKILDKNS